MTRFDDRRHRRPPPGRAALLASLAAISFTACDFPTELPYWDTTWVVPAQESTIDLTSILPAGVSPAGSDFAIDLDPAVFSRSVGEMCLPCVPFHGLLVPKPAFTAEFGGSIALPADAVSISVAGGVIEVQVRNGLGFDPIRPSPTVRGHIVLVARSGNATLARDSVAGEDTAFPPGSVLSRNLPLAAARAEDPISIEVRIVSPAGDPVRFDASARLEVIATPEPVRLADVRVLFVERPVSAAATEVGLEDVDDGVLDRLRGGALRLTVTNPLDVAGALDVRVAGPEVEIVRQVQVQAGTTQQRVELTGDELRRVVGRPGVTIGASGILSTPPAGALVQPTDSISIRSQVELTIGKREN